MADCAEVYLQTETGHRRWLEWRLVDWRLRDATAGFIRRGAGLRGSDGHVAVRSVRPGRRLGRRLWIAAESGGFQSAARLLAVSQRKTRDAVSANYGDYRRSRCARNAGALLQIRGSVASCASGTSANI